MDDETKVPWQPSADASSAQWKKLLRHCLYTRADVSEFRDFSKLMIKRASIPSRRLIDLALDSREVTNVEWDPLLPLYIDSLFRLGALRMPDVLSSLLMHSIISGKETPDRPSVEVPYRPATLMMEHRIIQNLMIALTAEYTPDGLGSARSTFSAIADWMSALLTYGPDGEGRGGTDNNAETENGHQQQLESIMSSSDTIMLFESLGILFAALASTEVGVNALSAMKEQTSDLKDKLSRALSAYIRLCAEISIPLRNRLLTVQKDFGLHTAGDKMLDDSIMGNVAMSALNFESNVVDTPAVNSRAGLFIYVNAMLVGRPLVDNNMFLNYLNNRYGRNRMVLVEEVITAAFDVLSNGMYRNESNRTMFIFRAFLVNKLPPFLAEMSSALGDSTPMEVPITRAFGRIDPNTFPSFSESFAMQGNSVLSDVRQEFLFSCALHRLIPESSIEQLLGENPMQTLPVGGQYRRDRLVSQINSNAERAEQLLNEVEAMEGNAGAIVDALVEVIHNLCSRKETMTLKSVCNALTRKPQSLDTMLLFKSPATILQPLCALLDDWKWDEEQGEKQLVYDEFGSILLLILAFKYKYDLTHNDIGINNADSFVLRLLEVGHSSQKLEDMTEKQTQNLGAWITALFIAEGISDESMSSCSPQEFYLVVATLFSQSLGACESGKLEFETLKGGFEYLLEPFLLPALVMALAWLGNHIWESETDLTISLKVLHTLIRPSSISGEAQEIHRTVLLISARTLEGQLKDLRARHPSRNDIKPILDTIEPCRSFRRTGAAHRSELDTWKANSAGGGLITSIRNTFSSLVLWSTDPEISLTPPSYTHRQLLAGIRLLGSARVLQGLLDELKLQAETGSADLSIDIAATLVCAPLADSFAEEQAVYHQNNDPSSSSSKSSVNLPRRSRLLPLRDALNLQRESLGKIIEVDPYRAELVVRLRRRVEALTALPQMAAPAVQNIVDNIMGDINLEDVQAGTGQGQEQQQQQQQQQLSEATMQANGLGGAAAGAPGGENSGKFGEMLGVIASRPSSATEPGAAITAAADPNHVQGIGVGVPNDNGLMNPGDFDDVLGMEDIGVGDPELIDLDMEGMF